MAREVQVLKVICGDGQVRYTKTIAGKEMKELVAFAESAYGLRTLELVTIPERQYDELAENPRNILRKIII